MRIAYLAGWPGGPDTGPFKKIAEQCRLWQTLGADVGLFILTTAEHEADWSAIPGVVDVTVRHGNAMALAGQKERLLRKARAWAPDVLYHRYALAYPGLVAAVRRLPVVLEINTDDVSEYRLIAPKKAVLNQATRGLVLGRAAGLVAVTEELAGLPTVRKYGRPTAVVANGIHLDSVRELPAPSTERPTFAFIGQPDCPWHGVDKVVELARARGAWDFHVVGPDHAEVAAAAGTPPSNVHVHGLQTAERYMTILGQAHIGIASLALHRKNMQEASPLKLREYFAAGLPAITAYRDTDFMAPVSFLLELPNVEDNIGPNLPTIDRFVASQYGSRVARAAIAHIDGVNKERQRLEFFGDATRLWRQPPSLSRDRSGSR